MRLHSCLHLFCQQESADIHVSDSINMTNDSLSLMKSRSGCIISRLKALKLKAAHMWSISWKNMSLNSSNFWVTGCFTIILQAFKSDHSDGELSEPIHWVICTGSIKNLTWFSESSELIKWIIWVDSVYDSDWWRLCSVHYFKSCSLRRKEITELYGSLGIKLIW